MAEIILGVGEFAASKQPDDTLKTYALGSCIAVIFMDPKARIIGMDHIALPESRVDAHQAQKCPGYFADTGIPALLRKMSDLGSTAKGKSMIVKLIGGASVLEKNNSFNIGKRNYLAIKKILWKYGMGPRAEDVGGSLSRTVSIDLRTGKAKVSSPNREDILI